MKKLLAAGIVFATLSPAVAADLPRKAPVYQTPPPAPISLTWTGCYVGGNLGEGWSHSNFSTVVDSPAGSFLSPTGAAVLATAGTGSANQTRFIGGGQIGCNWQSGVFVAGLEGDFDSFSVKLSTMGAGTLAGVGNPVAVTNSLKTTWLATVRPRLGVAIGPSLLYATGGLALTNMNFTQTYVVGPTGGAVPANGFTSASQVRAGWTVGAGWEYAFTNNWSARIEYLYSQFSSLNANGLLVSTAATTNPLHGFADLRDQVVRAGLNYRFSY